MANTIASSAPFASFDVNARTNILDISPVLSEALLLGFNFMERGINVAMDNPVEDTLFSWNEEALNSDQLTTVSSVSYASTSTAIVLTAGHGLRVHVGDLLKAVNNGSTTAATEVMQVVDQATTDNLTVVRGYNSTVATSMTSGATFSVIPMYQEGTDIGIDKSVKPIDRTNYTQIEFAGDLLISRSQLARKMATIAMDVDRQLANRAKELKRYWTTTSIYGEKSASAGSEGSPNVLRSTLGLRGWIRDNSGILNSTAEALSITNLNSTNKSVVDKGAYVDTLLIGTDLVGAVNTIEATNRRLVESDKQVGWFVNRVVLGQGNEVEVVVDGRVHSGDAFMYEKNEVSWRPLVGGAMFVIAATDFTDGVKRRIGSEAGIECRHPEAKIYLSVKT